MHPLRPWRPREASQPNQVTILVRPASAASVVVRAPCRHIELSPSLTLPPKSIWPSSLSLSPPLSLSLLPNLNIHMGSKPTVAIFLKDGTGDTHI